MVYYVPYFTTKFFQGPKKCQGGNRIHNINWRHGSRPRIIDPRIRIRQKYLRIHNTATKNKNLQSNTSVSLQNYTFWLIAKTFSAYVSHFQPIYSSLKRLSRQSPL